METIKIEVSEYELSLLIGLVEGRILEYQEIATHNAADLETMSGARSLKDLYEKLYSAKAVPARS